MNDIRTEIEEKNRKLTIILCDAIWNLKDKLEKYKESAKILIKAGNLLDYRLIADDSYGNFSILIDEDKALAIYYDYNHIKKCIAWYERSGFICIKENIPQVDAYSAIEIYNKLGENIEKLIDKAFVEIKNRYDKKEKEYCNK